MNIQSSITDIEIRDWNFNKIQDMVHDGISSSKNVLATWKPRIFSNINLSCSACEAMMPKTKHELNARQPSFLNLERSKGCENHVGILRSFVMIGRLRHETHIINGLIFLLHCVFEVTTYQMCILMLFNQHTSLTYKAWSRILSMP